MKIIYIYNFFFFFWGGGGFRVDVNGEVKFFENKKKNIFWRWGGRVDVNGEVKFL